MFKIETKDDVKYIVTTDTLNLVPGQTIINSGLFLSCNKNEWLLLKDKIDSEDLILNAILLREESNKEVILSFANTSAETKELKAGSTLMKIDSLCDYSLINNAMNPFEKIYDNFGISIFETSGDLVVKSIETLETEEHKLKTLQINFEEE